MSRTPPARPYPRTISSPDCADPPVRPDGKAHRLHGARSSGSHTGKLVHAGSASAVRVQASPAASTRARLPTDTTLVPKPPGNRTVHIGPAWWVKTAAEVDRELPGLTELLAPPDPRGAAARACGRRGEDFVRRARRPARSRPAAMRPTRLSTSRPSASAGPRPPPTRCARPCRARPEGFNGRPVRGVQLPAPDRSGDREGRPGLRYLVGPPGGHGRRRRGRRPRPGLAGGRHRACPA